MINLEEFTTPLLPYGNDFIIEIIDLFENGYKDDNPPSPSYEERVTSISNAISQSDYAGIKFHAHSIKGAMAYFYDSEASELAGLLEKMGALRCGDKFDDDEFVGFLADLEKLGIENTEKGIAEIFELFKISTQTLLNDLKQYRNSLKA